MTNKEQLGLGLFTGRTEEPPQIAERRTDPMDYKTPIYRVQLVRDSSVNTQTRPTANSPQSLVELIQRYLDGTDRENFVVVMLDTKLKVIGIHTVAIGALDRCTIRIAEVFKPLIIHNAAAFAIAHNHPSGSPEPSTDDKRITRSIAEVAKTMEIRLVDHIIIGDGTPTYFSFSEHSLL